MGSQLTFFFENFFDIIITLNYFVVDYNHQNSNENLDSEKMLRKNNYGSGNDDEAGSEKKLIDKKYEAFKYDNSKQFVSYFDKANSLDIIDAKATTTTTTATARKKKLPVSKSSTPFFPTNTRHQKKKQIDEKKSKSQLIFDLNEKLYSIPTIINGCDEDLYSTTRKANKELSLNTLSTNFQSDSPTIQTKMVTFTSEHSLNDKNETPSRPQLSTFNSNSNNIYSTIKRQPVTKTSPNHQYDNSNDIYESKFLSNLCEEIEMTLNVDCMCDESISSAQCDSNVNSELSTVSSVGGGANIPQQQQQQQKQQKNYQNYSVNKILRRGNNNHDDNSNMIVNTSRAPNERINDYNYSNRPNRAHDDFAIRKSAIKHIGVLV